MLGEITERALAHTGKPELLLTGGVAANKRLGSIIRDIAEDHGATSYIVPIRLAADNGAMIAWTGLIAYKSGHVTCIDDSHINPNWRMDQVKIPWRN
jgi:N6-L-threonylcarbamoyladenine synthase